MSTSIKYPKQITVYITRSTLAHTSTHLSRHKFLVAPTITIQILSEYVRHSLKLSQGAPLFLFINNVLQTPNTSIADIYFQFKNIDGELHMIYSTENIINNLNLYSCSILKNIIS